MVYTKQTWTDGPSGNTPVNAARLGHMEDGIAAAYDSATGVFVRPTGVAATDTAALQAAISTAQASSQDLYLLPGTFKLTTGLIWNGNKGSLVACGDVVLDFTALTSGYAITITGNGSTGPGTYAHRGVNYKVAGFRMIGPDTDATTVDGILITDTGIGADNITLERLMVLGFRDGISYGDNLWLIDHRKIYVGNCHRYGINGTMGTNAGEAMDFYGCIIGGCRNASGTGVGLYIPATGPYADWFFFGGSFDYSDMHADINGHHVEFNGVHFEDNNTYGNPMVQTATTPGQDQTYVAFNGVTLGPTEAAPGRDALVVTKASNGGDRVSISFSGLGGKYDTKTTLYKNLSSALPTVRLNGFNLDAGGVTNIPQYGPMFNQLANGSFDTNTTVTNGLGGWTLPASYDFFAGLVHSAPYSLRITTTTGTAYQVVPVRPASPVSISGYVACNNYTSGSATFQVQFLAADRTTVLSTLVMATMTATQGWKGYQRRVMPPPGAMFASVQWVATSFVGNAELDDVQLVLP